jgi:hypothetical protein
MASKSTGIKKRRGICICAAPVDAISFMLRIERDCQHPMRCRFIKLDMEEYRFRIPIMRIASLSPPRGRHGTSPPCVATVIVIIGQQITDAHSIVHTLCNPVWFTPNNIGTVVVKFRCEGCGKFLFAEITKTILIGICIFAVVAVCRGNSAA